MATLFVLMILVGIIGCIALIRWSEGPVRNHSRSPVMQRRYLGNFKYEGE